MVNLDAPKSDVMPGPEMYTNIWPSDYRGLIETNRAQRGQWSWHGRNRARKKPVGSKMQDRAERKELAADTIGSEQRMDLSNRVFPLQSFKQKAKREDGRTIIFSQPCLPDRVVVRAKEGMELCT